jgi:hypothetical protein
LMDCPYSRTVRLSDAKSPVKMDLFCNR